MTKWFIRSAKAEDGRPLAVCIDAAYAIYAGKGIDLPAVSDGIDSDIQNNIVWVATIGRRIVGGLVLIPQESQAVLANVVVDPSASGLGLGRALMERAEQKVREMGLGELKLTTHIDIPENVRLYEHLGWRETGRSGNKVSMAKTLSDEPPARQK